MIGGPATGRSVVIMILLVSYAAFFGGVEAGRQASDRADYLETRENITGTLEEVRYNSSEIVEMWRGGMSEDKARDLEEAGLDPEASEALSRPIVEVNQSSRVDSPPPIFHYSFQLVNFAVSPTIRATRAGVDLGYRYPFLSYHLIWFVNISILYASPWILLAWHKSQKRKAREAAGG